MLDGERNESLLLKVFKKNERNKRRAYAKILEQ